MGPKYSCKIVLCITNSFYVLALVMTNSLFLLRIHAVYLDKPSVLAFFRLSWIATLACSILIPLSAKAEYSEATDICSVSSGNIPSAASLILTTVFDTLVFLAMSWRLSSMTMVVDTTQNRIRAAVRGEGLPRLSTILLHEGQIYYWSANFFWYVADVLGLLIL